VGPALLALTLGACFSGSEPDRAQRPDPVVQVSSDPLVVEVHLGNDGERMAYDVTEFEVPAGAEVRLTLVNTSRTMFHNWVLVQPRSEDEVGSKGILVGIEKSWVPDLPAVLAATRAAPPGTQVRVTFRAPAPGTYPYLCTVPGHQIAMRGRMRVLDPAAPAPNRRRAAPRAD